MNDGLYFADAELPFHVWVREGRGEDSRWVLREVALDDATVHATCRAAAADAAPGPL